MDKGRMQLHLLPVQFWLSCHSSSVAVHGTRKQKSMTGDMRDHCSKFKPCHAKLGKRQSLDYPINVNDSMSLQHLCPRCQPLLTKSSQLANKEKKDARQGSCSFLFCLHSFDLAVMDLWCWTSAEASIFDLYWHPGLLSCFGRNSGPKAHLAQPGCCVCSLNRQVESCNMYVADNLQWLTPTNTHYTDMFIGSHFYFQPYPVLFMVPSPKYPMICTLLNT